jgi:hypothetical protein
MSTDDIVNALVIAVTMLGVGAIGGFIKIWLDERSSGRRKAHNGRSRPQVR